MSVQIQETGDIDLCLHLRRVVFIDEQNVPEEEEIDDLDQVSQHLLAYVDDTPVGSARLTIKGDVAKIGRVCVLRDHRGTGIGEALITASLDLARAKGAAQAKLGAQTHALGFYQRLGFAAVGPVYDDAGIPHRDMVRDL